MNRHVRTPGSGFGGPSKATATTMCQKCLKRDMSCLPSLVAMKANFALRHYSYECKSTAQERPYVSRPSRTQQLLNPKLLPKLTNDAPQDLLRKKGVADEVLAKAERERGRKRERQSEEPSPREHIKRMRSASVSSVSTISTGISRSPSPPPNGRVSPPTRRANNDSRRRVPRSRPQSNHSRDRSYPAQRQSNPDSARKRRRDSLSSVDSYSSNENRASRERTSSRNTRRRFEERSPVGRGRRSYSRSPFRTGSRSEDRPLHVRPTNHKENDNPILHREERSETKVPARQRSLSPFSKRLALTQAMNG